VTLEVNIRLAPRNVRTLVSRRQAVADKVDKVYPELVIRDEAGKIQGARYDERRCCLTKNPVAGAGAA
jgi:hypothetical protein